MKQKSIFLFLLVLFPFHFLFGQRAFSTLKAEIISQELFFEEVRVQLKITAEDANYKDMVHLTGVYDLAIFENPDSLIVSQEKISFGIFFYSSKFKDGKFEDKLEVRIPIKYFNLEEDHYLLTVSLSDSKKTKNIQFELDLLIDGAIKNDLRKTKKEQIAKDEKRIDEIKITEAKTSKSSKEIKVSLSTLINPNDKEKNSFTYDTFSTRITIEFFDKSGNKCSETIAYDSGANFTLKKVDKINFNIPYTSIYAIPGENDYEYRIYFKQSDSKENKLIYKSTVNFTQPQLYVFDFIGHVISIDVEGMDIPFLNLNLSKGSAGKGRGDLFLSFKSATSFLYQTGYIKNSGIMIDRRGKFQFFPNDRLILYFMDHDVFRSETIDSHEIKELKEGNYTIDIQETRKIHKLQMDYTVSKVNETNYLINKGQ